MAVPTISEVRLEPWRPRMTMENGVMKMRPAEGGLEIKPGETVMLKPSSAHLMFLDLKHPLEQGNTAAATLQFEKAGAAQVEFPIAAIGASAPGAATGGTMMHGGGMMQICGGSVPSSMFAHALDPPEALDGLGMVARHIDRKSVV